MNYSGEENSYSMAFDALNLKNDSDSSDLDNFEEGSNQIELQSALEMVDGNALDRLVSEYANFNEQFKQMSVKQRTSYFVR
jgi:hypothetical protein